MLTYEVAVTGVVRGRYETIDKAWELVEHGLYGSEGESRQELQREDFFNDPYTRSRRAPGWLLAFQYEPANLIMAPRPLSSGSANMAGGNSTGHSKMTSRH